MSIPKARSSESTSAASFETGSSGGRLVFAAAIWLGASIFGPNLSAQIVVPSGVQTVTPANVNNAGRSVLGTATSVGELWVTEPGVISAPIEMLGTPISSYIGSGFPGQVYDEDAGGLLKNTSNGKVEFSGPITILGDIRVSTKSGTTLIISGGISGRGDANFGLPPDYEKGYEGTIELRGKNTFSSDSGTSGISGDVGYSGDVGIWGGTVILKSPDALSETNLIKVGRSGTLDLGGYVLMPSTVTTGVSSGQVSELWINGGVLRSGMVGATATVLFDEDYEDPIPKVSATIDNVDIRGNALATRKPVDVTVSRYAESFIRGTLEIKDHDFTKKGEGFLCVGTLQINGSGAVINGGGKLIVSGGELCFENFSSTGPAGLVVLPGGLFNGDVNDRYRPPLSWTKGVPVGGSGLSVSLLGGEVRDVDFQPEVPVTIGSKSGNGSVTASLNSSNIGGTATLAQDANISVFAGMFEGEDVVASSSIQNFAVGGHQLTKIDGGDLSIGTLSVTNGGAVTVSAGMLEFSNFNATGAVSLTVLDGAVLNGDGDDRTQRKIGGSGTTVSLRGGTLKDLTITADASVDFGTPGAAGTAGLILKNSAILATANLRQNTIVAVDDDSDGASEISSIAGKYALTKSGLGTLKLTGASKSFTGNLDVAGGTLEAVHADAITSASTIMVASAAVLDTGAKPYAFSLGQLMALSEGSTLKLTGAGASTFAGANIQLNISAASIQGGSITSAKLVVGGTQANGLSLNPHVQIQGISGQNVVLKTSPLIMSDVISAKDAAVNTVAVSGTLLFDRNPLYTITNSGSLTARYNGLDGLPSGLRSAASVLDKINGDNSLSSSVRAALTKVFDTIVQSAGSSSAIGRIVAKLTPVEVADQGRAGAKIASSVGQTVENRMSEIGQASAFTGAVSVKMGVAPSQAGSPQMSVPGASVPLWNAWTSGYNSNGGQRPDSSSGSIGSSIHGNGGAIGIDRAFGDLRLGVLGSGGFTRISGDESKTEIDSWHLGSYAILPLEQLVFDGAFVAGMSDTTRKRSLLGTSYRADYDSKDLQASVGISYNLLSSGGAFQTAPVARLTYVNYRQAAMNETITNGAPGLPTHLNSFSESQWVTKLGQRFQVGKSFGSLGWSLDASAYWQHHFQNEPKAVGASFVGVQNSSFTVRGGTRSKDNAVLDGGMTVTLSEKHALRVGATREFGGDQTSTTGVVTVSTKF